MGGEPDKRNYKDYLDTAKELHLEGNDWEYPSDVKPASVEPIQPSMREVPTEKAEYYKLVEWGNILCDIFLLIFHLLIYIPLGLLILRYLIGPSVIRDEWYYRVGFVLGIGLAGFFWYFIISIITAFVDSIVNGGKFRDKFRDKFFNKWPYVSFKKIVKVKSRIIKLSPQEIAQLKTEARLQYEKDMIEYYELKEKYEKEKLEYDERKKETESKKKAQLELLYKYRYVIAGRILKKYIPDNEPKMCEISSDMPQRGANEDSLFYELMKEIPSCVKVDRSFNGYFPDLVIYDKYHCPCPIDVEIDEPYECKTKKEIHYIGCGDDARNEMFVLSGWFVEKPEQTGTVRRRLLGHF